MSGEVGALAPGAVFGRDFRVVKALRAGGMGAVYIVDQLSTGKKRALKVMAPELLADQSTRDRFVLEARVASRIESDHVVEIVTAGVDEETGAPFLVMELLKGEELADVLARGGVLALGDVAEVLAQIGHALEQAHAQGIVHRDLKPENIFLATSRRRDAAFTAKILDFGIAKLVADSQKTGTQPLGTPLFMSPEQTDRKGRICPATDVWALGLITFRLLTGRDFWRQAEGDSLAGLLREIVMDPIAFASVRAKEVWADHLLPPGFDAWFARCVNRDIDARFPEAGEAVRAFADLVPPDAPRGKLVVQVPVDMTESAPLDSLPSGAFGTGAAGAAGKISVTPPHVDPRTVAPAAATASAIATTHEPAAATTAAKKSGLSKLLIALPIAALIGAAVFLFNSRKVSGPSGPMPPTLPNSAASASAGAAVAAAPQCDDGMILIPGGKVFLGARDLTDDAKPPHEVTISTFCLDKMEVTAGAYDGCAAKGECERAPTEVSFKGMTEPMKARYSPLCTGGKEDRSEHPINCVTWSMASGFCQKRGARLPTEAEWEYAARGSGQRNYPWGDDAPSAKFLNACGKECVAWGLAHADPQQPMYDEDDGFALTAPVGSFPAGASAHGVLDLAGNVWEWTADWYAPYTAEPADNPKGPATGTERVARGGNFFGRMPEWARPAYRWKTDPETYSHAIGFRCAKDASGG